MKSTALSFVSLVVGLLLVAPLGGDLEAQERQERSFTAQVVDVACYTVHDLKDEGHRECAQVCADQGVSLVLLDSDGRLYHPVGEAMPSSGVEENERLRPHAERMVNVTGTVINRGGLRTIVIQSVSAAQ